MGPKPSVLYISFFNHLIINALRALALSLWLEPLWRIIQVKTDFSTRRADYRHK